MTEGLEVWISDRYPRGRGIVTSVRGGNPISTNEEMIMFVLLVAISSYEILVAIIQGKPVILNIRGVYNV